MTKRDALAALRLMRAIERAALPPRKQPRDRRCLRCGKEFASAHCGNRLCLECKAV
jgi:hypothetical protein